MRYYNMAHHKRKKPKTFWVPTCWLCMFHGIDKPSKQSGNDFNTKRNGMGRHPFRDWKQPQWWDEDGKPI